MINTVEKIYDDICNIYNQIGLKNLVPKIKNFFEKEPNENETVKNNDNTYVYNKHYDVETNNFPHYKYFYNDSLKKLVYEIYYNDFINFNYDKNEIF